MKRGESMSKLKTYSEWRLHENLREYDFYFRYFKNLLFNKYRFLNLNDISERYVKETLFNKGFGIFYMNKYGFLQFSSATASGYNCYNEPTIYTTTPNNNFDSEVVHASNCIVMYNNSMRLPSINDVHYFAKKLSDIDKTIIMNLEQLKKSVIITCPDGQKKTVERVLAEKESCNPYIIVEKDFSNFNGTLDFFKTQQQNFCNELEEEKKIIINNALDFFGINNVPIEKKERLITDEANANNEKIMLADNSYYTERLNALISCNEKFDTDFKIERCVENE